MACWWVIAPSLMREECRGHLPIARKMAPYTAKPQRDPDIDSANFCDGVAVPRLLLWADGLQYSVEEARSM